MSVIVKTTAKSPTKKDLKVNSQKSVIQEGDDIAVATRMIMLGARLLVLEHETNLSRDKMSRLYREVKGCSPAKGMVPFSLDWFIPWRANVHSSIFYSIHRYLVDNTPAKGVYALMNAYTLYLEHDEVLQSEEPILSFTRAWMLLKFIKSDMLQMTHCSLCAMEFVTHSHTLTDTFECPVCKPPARIVGMLMRDEEKARQKRAKNYFFGFNPVFAGTA